MYKNKNSKTLWVYAVVLFACAAIVLLWTGYSQIKINNYLQEYEDKLHDKENVASQIVQQEDIDLEKVWAEVKEMIKKERIALYAFIEKGIPYLKKGTIVVEYPEEYALLKEELSKAENKSFIEGILKELVGKAIPLKFELRKNEEELLVQQVKEFFGEDIEII